MYPSAILLSALEGQREEALPCATITITNTDMYYYARGGFTIVSASQALSVPALL